VSVTAPRGFLAAGVACGIKASGTPDLALVVVGERSGSGGARATPAPAAAVFTTNKAAAAPVQVSRRHLATSAGRAGAVVLSSGNANAATGAQGLAVAERMCELVAVSVEGLSPEQVLVCSTGLIGIPLPLAPLEAGIPAVARALGEGPEAGEAAARAILTTDTRTKQACVERPSFTVGAMAKGAAMLAPNLATMLAVVTTDAAGSPAELAEALSSAVADSFNSLTVDGCCSTNDTVVLLSSGAAGPVGRSELAAAVGEVCADLAAQMAADAEGATRVARVTVEGAASTEEARRAARRVAESQLVQCSLHGGDPYWGRVVSELGSAGVAFELDRVRVLYGGVVVCDGGVAVSLDPAAAARLEAHMSGPRVELVAHLGLGEGRASVLTTDLGPGYIAENMRTS
jgi:glutamate N-acetyltransferase/amino-acid N-acetyltransferase